MTSTHRFEERLLEELSAVVAARPAPGPAATVPATGSARVPRRHVPRGRAAFAGATVAAAVAAVAVFASSGDHTTAAYAVTPQPSGAVTVTIRSLADADGLQRALDDAGLPAVVDYRPGGGDAAGCTAARGGGAVTGGTTAGGPTTTRHRESGTDTGGPTLTQSGPGLPPAGTGRMRVSTSVRMRPDGTATFSIDPGELLAGQKVFITTSTGKLTSIAVGIGETRPAPCPAPAPGP